MHAEICYAECLLQKAALTFVQVMNIWFRPGILWEDCQHCGDKYASFSVGALVFLT